MIDTIMPAQALPAKAASASAPGQTLALVAFEIARQRYALPLPHVFEVLRLPALVPLAGAPPMLCGLLNLRGQYLPALDGCALIGEPQQYDLTSQVIIVGDRRPELALLVHQVRDICTVSADQIASLARHTVALLFAGVIALPDGSVLLFDLPALLALAPAQVDERQSAGAPLPIAPLSA